jgi:hypothetical protein
MPLMRFVFVAHSQMRYTALDNHSQEPIRVCHLEPHRILRLVQSSFLLKSISKAPAWTRIGMETAASASVAGCAACMSGSCSTVAQYVKRCSSLYRTERT